MTLILGEEQRLLADTAREFLQANAPVAALRALRDARDPLGYSAELWRQMGELGWAGVLVPEEFGGAGFGFAGIAAVLEQTGRTLCASPLLATAVLGASAILLGGSAAQKDALLPRIAAGELTLALALEESHRHAPAAIATRAEALPGGGFRLGGDKQFVLDGHSAGLLVVVARTAGEDDDTAGISLFLVDPATAGVSRRRTTMLDGRNAANIAFDRVELGEDALLGELHAGWRVLEPVLDRGRAGLAAEMLGGAREVFERTVDYLKQREQFGARIGTFQGLQHRAAQVFTELELCETVVRDACSNVDGNPALLPLTASLAKAFANDVYHLASSEAVQMHGGIGVTDALDIGLFLKRSRVCSQILGDSAFHRARYATLRGF